MGQLQLDLSVLRCQVGAARGLQDHSKYPQPQSGLRQVYRHIYPHGPVTVYSR